MMSMTTRFFAKSFFLKADATRSINVTQKSSRKSILNARQRWTERHVVAQLQSNYLWIEVHSDLMKKIHDHNCHHNSNNIKILSSFFQDLFQNLGAFHTHVLVAPSKKELMNLDPLYKESWSLVDKVTL